MKFLMRSFGGEDVGGCELALVHLDNDRVREILALRELFQMAKSKAPKLWKMGLWDASVEFYDLVDDEDADEEDEDDLDRDSCAPRSSLTGEQGAEFDSENYLVLPDDFEMGREPRRTECDELRVTAEGFYWASIISDTDARVETAEIRYEVLLDALASQVKS